jgi:hypothetical protein
LLRNRSRIRRFVDIEILCYKLLWKSDWYRTCARLLAGRPGWAGGGLMTASLRPITAPFVAAAPSGARVRARLRVCARDEAVLWAAGAYLGSLAARDLAVRCAEGRLDAKGRARSRAVRKRALTAASSSRWAGAITRTSEDQVRLAGQNLRAGRSSLQARIGLQRGPVGYRYRPRLHLPVGSRALAAAPAGAPPEGDRSPRGSAGNRATRARVPGQAPRDREPDRPGGGGTAGPGAAQDTPPPGTAPRKPATPRGPRQPPGTKTRRPHRTTAGNQAAQDRPGPPTGQDHVLLVQ